LLSKWPIRVKLLVGLALLVLVVTILSGSGLIAMYAYRGLVKSLSRRVVELPTAAELSRRVADMRITLGELHGLRGVQEFHTGSFLEPMPEEVPSRMWMVRDSFRSQLELAEDTLTKYSRQLEHPWASDLWMADNRREWATVRKIQAALQRVHEANSEEDWMLDDMKISRLDAELEELQTLSAELPSHLHTKLHGFAKGVRGQYRMLIIGTWITIGSAALVFALFIRVFWRWILHPLRILIRGSRRVAAGEFSYRIHLNTDDEMSELADAMNAMTSRFQDIRDDLDRQVRERTKQVVRSEQLASVGFLAAGVAHEINNPLASIAMCAESMEGRIRELVEPSAFAKSGHTGAASDSLSPSLSTERLAVVGNYLQMIQNEAFRCKEITEKLLDFSRIGEAKRQNTELGELIQSVVDMVGHLGKYQHKHIEFVQPGPVIAPVNSQEIKQVVLNLLTNALDSLDEDGTVRIDLRAVEGMAHLTFTDDGCGIDPNVLEHIFEPFFTRRRAGQGTGLGLSITYRILADHGGSIDAESPGPGQGATFHVRLPLAQTTEQMTNSYQAA
jgi:signal transduction histidine kinase